MVWSEICEADGKPRYIKKYNNMVVMAKDSKGALDEVPEGWKVKKTKNGYLKLMRIQ